MGFFLKTDISELKKLRDKIKEFSHEEKKKLCENIAKETATVLLRRVKQKTPVDTGNLRRNWNISSQLLPNGYESTVYNQTEYAPYVEYGHRVKKKNGFGWVKGQYMLTKSEFETSKLYTKIVDKNVDKALKELFK
ncbi:MAG: HK97 gp10 family phage protein [Methanobrevibacter sp.]|nr:HK97 gp10 family phage protein [Methanobrevibacter sp.]